MYIIWCVYFLVFFYFPRGSLLNPYNIENARKKKKSLSFLWFIFVLFSAGCYTEVVTKVENTFFLFQWCLHSEQAKLHFCPAMRSGGKEASMVQLSPQSLLHQQLGYIFHRLLLEDIATAFLAAYTERMLLCFSSIYKPCYRLFQKGPTTLCSLFPWNFRESPSGKKITCFNIKAAPDLCRVCWFTWW